MIAKEIVVKLKEVGQLPYQHLAFAVTLEPGARLILPNDLLPLIGKIISNSGPRKFGEIIRKQNNGKNIYGLCLDFPLVDFMPKTLANCLNSLCVADNEQIAFLVKPKKGKAKLADSKLQTLKKGLTLADKKIVLCYIK